MRSPSASRCAPDYSVMSSEVIFGGHTGAGVRGAEVTPGGDGGEDFQFYQRPKVQAAFFGDVTQEGQCIEMVYGPAQLDKIARITDLYPHRVTSANLEECLPELDNLQVIFATWGMMQLTDAQLDRLPSLQALFYAAGTIKFFGMPLLRRGITVTSSAAANALPVAEFVIAQCLLANKGYFRNVDEYRASRDKSGFTFRGKGNYGATIALLGLGKIGQLALQMMKPFDFRVVVFDPFLSAEEIRGMGAEKVGLAEAFALGDVVSNHLADVPETEGLITGELMAAMPRGATFINTGRGRTVRENEMIEVLRERRDLTALLDVTHPEPPERSSALWDLPNIRISGHIAGSIGGETRRMADQVIEEFERWSRGEPLHYAVTLEAVARMA